MPWDALGRRFNMTDREYMEMMGATKEFIDQHATNQPIEGLEGSGNSAMPAIVKDYDPGPDGANGVNISLRGDTETRLGQARGYPRLRKAGRVVVSQAQARATKAATYRSGINSSRTRSKKIPRIAIEGNLS